MQSFKALLILALAIVLAACGEAPQGEQVEAKEAVETQEASTVAAKFTVDNQASVINWEGSKLVGNDNHSGVISLQNGELYVEGGNITGGEFTIDMNSIKDTDIPDEGKRAKLEGHLKNGDFFEVEKYPTATFTIAKVEAVQDSMATHHITGNLMMKDSTKSITIPAKVEMTEGMISAVTPQFVIDRTAWNVMYGAGALGLAKDKIIRDEIGLKIDLKATKQAEME